MLPRYDLDHGGLAEVLVSDAMGDAMRAHAAAALPVAVALSPVGRTGDYAQSFTVDSEVDTTTRSPRQVGILANESDHAAPVEFGRSYDTADESTLSYDGHHVLARVADMIGGTT